VTDSLDLEVTHSRDALLSGSGEAPELSGAVTDSLDLEVTHSLDALLSGSGEAEDLTSEVFARLEQQSSLGLREDVLDAAGPAPDLSAGVFEQLGLAPAQEDELAPVVPLHPAPAAKAPVQAEPADGRPTRRTWLWAVPAVALPAVAMAAAALLVVTATVIAPWEQGSLSADELGFSPDVVNRIEIEEISSAADAIVHVIQGDFDDEAAPTIIFIDVLEDDADEAESGDGGTTL
jgi:hypothetical protein